MSVKRRHLNFYVPAAASGPATSIGGRLAASGSHSERPRRLPGSPTARHLPPPRDKLLGSSSQHLGLSGEARTGERSRPL